jgi:FO synthase
MISFEALLRGARDGDKPSSDEAMTLARCDDLAAMMAVAAEIRDRGHGEVMSYSRKVFIPLTKLCRDSCHYCTFAHPPRRGERSYLRPEEVIAIAQAGAAAGCREALFTLGDKPELRYRAAREELAVLGHQTTVSYLAAMSALVLQQTGLLPHLNPGVMSAREIADLRQVSVSQGLMLETAADRLSERGGPHFGSPDKRPAVRLEMIRAAGEAAVPFTSGILIGIGETRGERLQALLHLRDLHERHGHLQEIIIQNFRAKPGTRMASHAEPDLDDHLWTIAAARILFGVDMNIQAPPNLSPGVLQHLIAAGINDWGGVSPVTPDHVNPERPWPELDRLARETAKSGKVLVERLAIYPAYARQPERWLEPKLRSAVLRASDAEGFARVDRWTPGTLETPSPEPLLPTGRNPLAPLLDRAVAGRGLSEDDVVSLFASRGDAFRAVCAAADALREQVSGNAVSYVVTRNVNYTNVCYYRCKFCAFSKGKLSANLRGRPYDLSTEEIQRRTIEAWHRGAVEVCLQGGIHPDYDGTTYLAICRAIKDVCPAIHIHAFSPLEVWQGAATLGISVRDFLIELNAAGLGSMPGTAAEVLDDEVRAIICPDKVSTAQWLEVVDTAHRLGIRTTATIMFGHVDGPRHWARHLLHIRELQARTGGFTEFVPLPFVPMETPIHLHGQSRLGPTFREAVLMHAVARLVLHPHLTNIQTSWVKMGRDGAAACLQAGANDLGGTLMNESITRAAGAMHGQEMSPEAMEKLICSIGRQPRQRTTLYRPVAADRASTSFGAAPLLPLRSERAVRASPATAEHRHYSENTERTA